MKATFSMSSLGIGGGAIDRKEEDEENDPLKELRKDADMLRKTCFNNISAVYAKMGDWKKSLEKAQKVLELDEKNQKALFRSGVAYRNMREFEKVARESTESSGVGRKESKSTIQVWSCIQKLEGVRKSEGVTTRCAEDR